MLCTAGLGGLRMSQPKALFLTIAVCALVAQIEFALFKFAAETVTLAHIKQHPQMAHR